MPTIDDILANRSAFLKGAAGDRDAAHARCELTKEIEHNYPAFERLRDALLNVHRGKHGGNTTFLHKHASTHEDEWRLFDLLMQYGVLKQDADQFVLPDVDARRFVTGGWLEELAWLAAMRRDAGLPVSEPVPALDGSAYYDKAHEAAARAA